jgi:hypothetical protein
MNNSAKNRFKMHYWVLWQHFVNNLPFDPKIRELSKEDCIYKHRNVVIKNLSDEVYDTAKSLAIFFDQRDKMSFKEFNKALNEEYGDALNIERDLGEIENSEALRSIDRNIKTMRGIMVFFLVMWIIGIVATIIYALAALA